MIFRKYNRTLWTLLIMTGLLAACGQSTVEVSLDREEAPMTALDQRSIIANNAFFYYQDLEAAWKFYVEILGLETVADYGFAKIMRIAETSYLTLVDAEAGIHTADEPKTVAIALITDELDEWYEYLLTQDISMKSKKYQPEVGSPHDGFVAVDPEGYLLEFERFNPHSENARFMPLLDRLKSFYPQSGLSTNRPSELGFKATILWIYSKNVETMREFYETVMGFELIVDQGWAKIHKTSASGFIGPVDGAKGMHSWTQDKAVMISFLTSDIESWFHYLQTQPKFEFRKEEIGKEDRAGARVFVGYDPDGYFIEFDEFFEAEGNEALLQQLTALSDAEDQGE